MPADANPARAATLHAQNAQLDAALDRRDPRAVAVFAVEVIGVETYPVVTVLEDGTEVTERRTRAITRSVRLDEVA